jgi:hypothetical protein
LSGIGVAIGIALSILQDVWVLAAADAVTAALATDPSAARFVVLGQADVGRRPCSRPSE